MPPPDNRHRHVVLATGEPSARPTRVFEFVKPLTVGSDAEMIVISAENWTTFFALRWFFATTLTDTAIDQRLHDGLTWSCEDNLGNQYEGGDYGGGGGNSAGWTYTSLFAPCLDENASSLAVVVTSPIDGDRLSAVLPLR